MCLASGLSVAGVVKRPYTAPPCCMHTEVSPKCINGPPRHRQKKLFTDEKFVCTRNLFKISRLLPCLIVPSRLTLNQHPLFKLACPLVDVCGYTAVLTLVSFGVYICFHESQAGLDLGVEGGKLPSGAQTPPGRVSGGPSAPGGPLSFLRTLTRSFSSMLSQLFKSHSSVVETGRIS